MNTKDFLRLGVSLGQATPPRDGFYFQIHPPAAARTGARNLFRFIARNGGVLENIVRAGGRELKRRDSDKSRAGRRAPLTSSHCYLSESSRCARILERGLSQTAALSKASGRPIQQHRFACLGTCCGLKTTRAPLVAVMPRCALALNSD
jgi:hypothetical protein